MGGEKFSTRISLAKLKKRKNKQSSNVLKEYGVQILI